MDADTPFEHAHSTNLARVLGTRGFLGFQIQYNAETTITLNQPVHDGISGMAHKATAGQQPPKRGSQASGARNAAPNTAPKKNAGAKQGKAGPEARKKQSQNETPELIPAVHGAEMYAALAVREKTFARFQGKIILALLLLCIFSLAWNSVQNWTRPEPKLLAMTTDGRIQPLPLLDEPLDNRQTLVDWTRRNIPDLYEFNYANYRGKLNENLTFMQPRTLQSFQKMLNDSGILPRVREDFLILRANISNEPLLVSEKVYDGVRVWLMEIPMNLIYDSGEVQNSRRQRVTQRIVFRAWIARANPMEYDGGLMLAKFAVMPREGE